MTDEDLLADVRNGADLDQLRPRPLRFAVPHIIPEGLTVLAGPPKLGKSWMALDLCLAVASGGTALGAIQVDQGRALYLALEDSDRRLQSRAHHLLGRRPIPATFDYMTAIRDPARLLEILTAYCQRWTDARIIVIDTLARVRPPQPKHRGAYEWDYLIGSQLKKLADEHGTALTAVTHTRQMHAADFVEAVSGTSGLTGAADTIVVLDRARGSDDGRLKVTGRDVDERDYAMRMNAGAWQLLDRPPATPGLSDRTVAVIDYVTTHPAGVRAAEVSAELGIPVEQARVYLSRLATADRISQPARGLYTPVMSVYRVAFQPSLSISPNTHITQTHRENGQAS